MELVGSRRDIADLITLIRFVNERRAALAEGGVAEAVATCDELLDTLRRELRTIYSQRWMDARVAAYTRPSPRPLAGSAWMASGTARPASRGQTQPAVA